MGRGLAVADVVEAVLELLPGDGGVGQASLPASWRGIRAPCSRPGTTHVRGGNGRQGCRPNWQAGSLPHRRGVLAVADVIEAVLELLSGNRGAVGPEAFAGRDLAEGVVLVNPVGGVGVGGSV